MEPFGHIRHPETGETLASVKDGKIMASTAATTRWREMRSRTPPAPWSDISPCSKGRDRGTAILRTSYCDGAEDLSDCSLRGAAAC